MLHFCEILPSPHSLGNGYGWNTRTTPSTTRLTYDACLPVCLKKMQKRRRRRRLHHQEASDRFLRRTLRALCHSVWTVTLLCCTTVDLAGSQDIDLHRSKQILLTFSSTGTTSTCSRKMFMQQWLLIISVASVFVSFFILYWDTFILNGAVRETGIMEVKENTSFLFPGCLPVYLMCLRVHAWQHPKQYAQSA